VGDGRVRPISLLDICPRPSGRPAARSRPRRSCSSLPRTFWSFLMVQENLPRTTCFLDAWASLGSTQQAWHGWQAPTHLIPTDAGQTRPVACPLWQCLCTTTQRCGQHMARAWCGGDVRGARHERAPTPHVKSSVSLPILTRKVLFSMGEHGDSQPAPGARAHEQSVHRCTEKGKHT